MPIERRIYPDLPMDTFVIAIGSRHPGGGNPKAALIPKDEVDHGRLFEEAIRTYSYIPLLWMDTSVLA
jgi:hypothetical protein